MQPAFSVIFFTVFSGAGYGLIAILGVAQLLNLVKLDFGFGIAAFLLALTGITVGLLSSTFHLGRPERAWRAVSQWRSSWLAREGVVAILAYGPICLFALIWLFAPESYGTIMLLVAGLSVLLAIITVYCTAQIYASLKTIRQWHNPWTIALYLGLGLSTGGLWFIMLSSVFIGFNIVFIQVASGLLIISMFINSRYWNAIDNDVSPSTSATATGLSDDFIVRQIESPHSQDNYLLKEMGYVIARKHAHKLRKITVLTAFIVPVILLLISPFIAVFAANLFIVLAALIGTFGIVLERWLFFAEARHTVMLYYNNHD